MAYSWRAKLTAIGKFTYAASQDNTLKIWDVETGRALRTLEGHTAKIRSVALTGDGMRAVSGSFDKTLNVWDVKSGCCRDVHL